MSKKSDPNLLAEAKDSVTDAAQSPLKNSNQQSKVKWRPENSIDSKP